MLPNSPDYPNVRIIDKSSLTNSYGRGPVTVTAEGPSDEIEVWAQHYMARWHPAGYGTSIQNKITMDNGNIRITMHRWSSCD